MIFVITIDLKVYKESNHESHLPGFSVLKLFTETKIMSSSASSACYVTQQNNLSNISTDFIIEGCRKPLTGGVVLVQVGVLSAIFAQEGLDVIVFIPIE